MTAEPVHEVITAPPPEAPPPAAGLQASIPMPAALASDDARAEAGSWAPSTRRSYVAGWRDFTQWCLDTGVRGLPAAPADVGRYLEHLVEARGRALATARSRLAAVSAAHRRPPPGRPPRPGVPAAGEGHAEAVGPGAREAAETGAGPDRRGPGRRQGSRGPVLPEGPAGFKDNVGDAR